MKTRGSHRQPVFPNGRDQFLKVDIDLSLAAWNTIGTHEVFTVTGAVIWTVVYFIRTTLASGGAATLQFGVEGATTNYSGNAAVAVFVADRFVNPAAAGVTAGLNWDSAWVNNNNANFARPDGLDIGYEILAAALTAGFIEARCFWNPLSDNGLIVAAAGGAL